MIASVAATGSGWLFTVLEKLGVGSTSARTISSLVVRPVAVVVVAVLAIVVAWSGSRVIRRLLGHVAHHATNRASSDHIRVRAKTVVSLVANLWRILVAAVAAVTILGIFGLNLTPLLASATVVGATLGFGAQLFVRDYLSGVLFTLEDQFGIGDTIVVGQVTGVVEEMDLRVTRVRATDGVLWMIPNGEIRTVANTSRGWAAAVVDVRAPHPDVMELAAQRMAVSIAIAELIDQPDIKAMVTRDPEILGLIETADGESAWRVSCHTSPLHRDALRRSLREVLIAALSTKSSNGT